jgi:hypothetical protein
MYSHDVKADILKKPGITYDIILIMWLEIFKLMPASVKKSDIEGYRKI